jgi:AcrR family transcriptional regulator
MQIRAEETRSQLLEAALRLFSQNGYDATGVADICQAAGVSKGAFYHHFPTKRALFLVLLQNWLAGIDANLVTLRQQEGDVPQLLLRMTDVLNSVFQDAGGRLPIFFEYWQQASRDPEIGQATIEPYRRYRLLFTELVQQGVEAGSFRPMDVQVAAQMIISLAVGLLLQGLLDPTGADWPQVARDGVVKLIDSWR